MAQPVPGPPLQERDNLGFLPIFSGNASIDQVMLDSSARVTFVNGDFYKKDLNNFGPNVGFAWDLTKDGRTAIRGGYSLTYVNEDAVTGGRAAARGNAGLSTTVNLTNQYRAVSSGLPVPSTPAFLSTRTLADQLALNANGVLWGIDPNLRQPSVHQISVGIQRDLGWKTVAEARYVGTNAIYELPFGRGRRWLANSTVGDAILGNWQVGAIAVWQSGSPISFFSGRGSFNRVGRSNCDTAGAMACNTALTTLSVDELKALLGVYRTPDGRLFWIDPKVVDPQTGRGVGPDNLGNTAGFEGQVFFNPVAGQVGHLPVLAFDGPRQVRVDLALAKRVNLPGRYRLELKGEAFNLFNTPSFFRGDININSTTFGRLTSVNVDARVIQLSARFDF